MTKPLFPVDGFEKGQTVIVNGRTATIQGFSSDNKRAQVKFELGIESYMRWVDMDDLTEMNSPFEDNSTSPTANAPTPSPSPMHQGGEQDADERVAATELSRLLDEANERIAALEQERDALWELTAVREMIPPLNSNDTHPPSGSPHSVGETNPPSGSPHSVGEEITKLHGLVAKLQVELEMLRDQLAEHEDFIDNQVAASFDEAERANETLLARTEVAVLPVRNWSVDPGDQLDWWEDLDSASLYARRVPDGWEFVSSQVTAIWHEGTQEIHYTEHITIKREVLDIDPEWDGGETERIEDEITQKIPVELLHAADED